MNKKILKLRSKLERARLAHKSGRFLYPYSIQSLAVEMLNSRVPLSALAQQTGLNSPTISKWSKKINGLNSQHNKASFRKLSLVSEPPSKAFCIVLQNGIRIECKSFHQLAPLLREVA